MDLLIVDDDVAICEELNQYFMSRDFEVICAYDGGQALDILRKQSVDIMLCDLHMPILSGMSLLEKLTELETILPVVMMSKQASHQELISFLRLPVYHFIEKPIVDLAKLEQTLVAAYADFQLNSNQQQLQFLNRKLEKSLAYLKVDLQAGRYVQRKMLPDSPKNFGSYEFSHALLASSYLSGDFVEYVLLGEQHVCFFIADVSGHGASSAFITVLLKNISARLRSAWMHSKDDSISSPAKFLQRINEEFLSLESGKHATLFVGVLDIVNHHLRYSIAGHHPLPILTTATERRYLEGKGRAVGLFPEYSVQEHQLQLPQSFSLILFTDGILEIIDEASIEAKEQVLLDSIDSDIIAISQLRERLSINEQEDFPDDIAVFLLRRCTP